MKIYVGIDLGTTNTTCTIIKIGDADKFNILRLPIKQLVRGKKVDDLDLFDKENILPSVVWLTGKNKIYTGQFCKKEAAKLTNLKDSYVIKSIKREIENDNWALNINGIVYNPKKISALILKTIWLSLSKTVSIELIQSIVITIPASFSSKMRRDTIEAALLAGFDKNKILLIDEPIAALFSKWEYKKDSITNINHDVPIMIFDMGGGTIDVTILNVLLKNKTVNILSTSRYNEVAGEDIDLEITALLLKKIREHEHYNSYFEYPFEKIPTHIRCSIVVLQNLAKRIKFYLNDEIEEDSGDLVGTIEFYEKNSKKIKINFGKSLPNLQPEEIFLEISEVLYCISPLISKERHKDEHEDYGRNILTPINQALKGAGITKHEIKSVYMVGGCTNFIPVLCELKSIFPNKLSDDLDPVYAVSEGAAKFAYLLENNEWKISEVTHEKIFLRRRGQPFLEILRDKIPIPSGNIKPVNPFQGNDTYEINKDTRKVYLEFYQGTHPGDPAMSLVHIENQQIKHVLKEKR
jgi:molecular chaperone DnaK